MLFIKNYATELKGKDARVFIEEKSLKDGKTECTLVLKIEGEEVKLLTTTVSGVATSMGFGIDKIAKIAKKTNVLDENDDTREIPILDNKVTEIPFYVKGTKTVIKDTSVLPNVIGEFDDKVKGVYYPRDVIVLILPKTVGHEPAELSIVLDNRNIASNTIYFEVNKNYDIGMIYPKYPVWGNLKFPAYIVLRATFMDASEKDYAAFKLSSKTNKTSEKNTLVDIDVQTAADYLEESFKILRERRKTNNNYLNDNKAGYKPNNKPTSGYGKAVSNSNKKGNYLPKSNNNGYVKKSFRNQGK